MKNNFGIIGLLEAGKAVAWGSKISIWDVSTLFPAFLSNSTCVTNINFNVITKRFNRKKYVGRVQKFPFSFCFCL